MFDCWRFDLTNDNLHEVKLSSIIDGSPQKPLVLKPIRGIPQLINNKAPAWKYFTQVESLHDDI